MTGRNSLSISWWDKSPLQDCKVFDEKVIFASLMIFSGSCENGEDTFYWFDSFYWLSNITIWSCLTSSIGTSSNFISSSLSVSSASCTELGKTGESLSDSIRSSDPSSLSTYVKWFVFCLSPLIMQGWTSTVLDDFGIFNVLLYFNPTGVKYLSFLKLADLVNKLLSWSKFLLGICDEILAGRMLGVALYSLFVSS